MGCASDGADAADQDAGEALAQDGDGGRGGDGGQDVGDRVATRQGWGMAAVRLLG